MVSNWILDYGCFLQLHLYRLTNDDSFLERFKKSETFWYKHLRDKKYGGVFTAVTPEGLPKGDNKKAKPWRTSYHEMEHALLNYLFLNLYVDRHPATLYFKFNCSESSRKFYVSPIDDPSVQIAEVRVNGQPVVWEACQTFSGSWGYHRDEMSWKSVDMLIQMLIDTVSKGGNLLLNVGPTG
jgi:alpha-L-fucosidase